ncbi:MAG: class I SAM-dependent methyltransferase, partial [Solirubrobacteraceae bacterium]
MATGWAEVYCRQLALTVELLWHRELPILASAPAFAAAETVVDLGAGDGTFGRRLAATFPDKRFLGVEPDAAIHAAGARSACPPNYRYMHAGYESVTGTYDLLLARLVVMYLRDRDALYAWARAHVRAAIVANYEDSASATEPPLPLVTAAIEHGTRSRADELATTYAGDRDLAGMPAEWAAAGFLPSGSAIVVADVSDADDRRVFHHIQRLSVAGINPEAISRSLLDELYAWSVDPSARASIGLSYHSLLNPL